MNPTTRLLMLPALALAVSLVLPAKGFAQEIPPIDRQFDKYWAKTRQIRNVHKRLFLKDGRHEFSIYSGVIPNDEFFNYVPLGLRYDWYFTEDFALEIAGSYIFSMKTDLEGFLEGILPPGRLNAELPQFLEWQAGGGVLWTPLHGKVGAFSTLLGHFDFGIFLGVMAIGTKVQKEGDPEQGRRVDVGGNVGATVRVYVHDYIAIRVDYRHYFYNARDADDNSRGLSTPAEITIGLSFFTPAPE